MQFPTPCNLTEAVLAPGRATPDKIALAILGPARAERWSFAALDRAVGAMAGGLLAQGLARGDRLLLRLDNSARFPIAFLGAIRAGLVPVPTAAGLTAPEITTLSQLVAPRAILADPGLSLPNVPQLPVLDPALLMAEDCAPPPPPHPAHPDDLAYIVFTSGSSGAPKAVAHAHRALFARRMMWGGWYGLRPSDRVLHAGAMNWTYTLGTGLLDPWSIGATALVPAPGTAPETLGLLAKRHDATILAGVPGIFRKLLKTPLPPLPKLRHGLSAGEALPQSLRESWRARTGTDLHEALGMSECSTFLSGSPDRPAPPGTIGYPQAGRQIAVLARDDDTNTSPGSEAPIGTIGTLAIHRSDPGLMLGYLHGARPDLPLIGDWFVTGDRVARCEDGAFTYHGRMDGLLTAGGFRIAPAEIEQAFEGLDELGDCAALTLHPSPETTLIALALTGTAPDAALQALAKSRLAPHKRPRAYLRLDTLPRTPTGKLDRRALARQTQDTTAP